MIFLGGDGDRPWVLLRPELKPLVRVDVAKARVWRGSCLRKCFRSRALAHFGCWVGISLNTPAVSSAVRSPVRQSVVRMQRERKMVHTRRLPLLCLVTVKVRGAIM